MTTREQMSPTDVASELLRAVNEERWNDVAQFVDPLLLDELREHELFYARQLHRPRDPMTMEDRMRMNPGMPRAVAEYFEEQSRAHAPVLELEVRRRFGVDTLDAIESMTPAELLGSIMRARDVHNDLRFQMQLVNPMAAELNADLRRSELTPVGEVINGNESFVLYRDRAAASTTEPSVLSLWRSPIGWVVRPLGQLFRGGGTFGLMAVPDCTERPRQLAVPQMAWTTRTFDQRLPVELFPSLLERFRSTPGRVSQALSVTSHRALTARPHGKWSVLEHVGHLLDLEELGERRLADFKARAHTLTAADMSNRKTEEANHNAAEVWGLNNRFRTARESLVAKLETLSAEDIAHVARHPRLQRPMNVVEWICFMCEHDDHHLAKLRAQATQVRGEIWDEFFSAG